MVVTVAHALPNSQAPSLAHYDVVIVGGGIVGLTLAGLLGKGSLKIALIERETQSQAGAKNQAYALHLRSQKILTELGLWSELAPQLQPFTTVQLSDADYPQVVQYQAEELNTDTIGYVASHQALLKTLHQHLKTQANIDYLCPYTVTAISQNPTAALVTLTGADQASQALTTNLIIAADGSQSPLRTQAGISQQGWAYPQNCVVATLEFTQAQAPIAYERFWPTGPLGVLPLSEHQYRIVWTLPAAQAEQALTMTDAAFIQALSPYLDPKMGEFRVLGKRFQFPTKLRQSQAYVKPRFALVGDAAHSCHPVGGQGLNLGLRDAAALAEVILQAWEGGADIGSLQVLKRYQRWRQWQNWLTLGFTDLLNRVFSNQAWGVVPLRRAILHLLGMSSGLRWLSLRFMAGLWGK